MDQWRVQPSEFDNMPYWRIEYMEEDLRDLLTEKNSQQEGGDKMDSQTYMKDFKKMQSQNKSSIMGMKMPKMNFPKL